MNTLSYFKLSFLLTLVHCNLQPPTLNTGVFTQSKSIGECQACRIFVESFEKGLERTSRGKYEGGDAAWEEEKLKKSYKRSEMRLIDIQDSVCKEETKYGVYCHNIAEKAEDHIEKWWLENPDDDKMDLFKYICIDKLELCCPKHHYGKECLPCMGNAENPCTGNGKCRGDGTRKGNGTCSCDAGYVGENCEFCHTDYYLTTRDDKTVCSPCHESCFAGCRGSTQKDCIACKPGYIFDSDEGCSDVDECEDVDKCDANEFCVNGEGSYVCVACDRSCAGCYGDGPDMCRKCANGYSKKGDLCIADREDEDISDKLTSTRYMTYVGLLVATGILLPKSTSIGGFIGLLVLSYIMGAEYYCMINGHTGLVDLKDFDMVQLFRT